MLSKVIQQFKGDGLKSNLMRGGLASIAIKIFGLGFSLLTAIILARTLGPEQYGVYSYVLAIVSILAIPAMFGLPTLIVRETAKAEVKQEWGLMRGLWSWANRITASLSLLIALIAAVILWLNRDSFSQIQFFTFAWGIAFIPLSALAALRGASLRGLRKVIQGQLPEQVLKPALFIVMLAAVALTGFTQFTAESAMMLNALSAGVAFVFGAWLLWRVKPKQLASVKREYERKTWFASVVPLAMVAGLDIVLHHADVIMLGLLATSQDVALYRVAFQGAALIVLATEAFKMISTPHFSKLFHQGDMITFQKLAIKNARYGLAFAIPCALIFILWGKPIISLVFGDEFVASYKSLVVLLMAQLIHVAIGVGGPLLNSCGYEKGTLIAQLVTVIINLILNYLFIPAWGVEGAAWATFIAICIRKIMIWMMTYYYLRIDTSVIGLFKYERKC